MKREAINIKSSLGVMLWRSGLVLLIAILSLGFQACGRRALNNGETAKAEAGHTTEKTDEHNGEENEIKLAPEALVAAGIETAVVVERQISARLRVTGSVETNQEQTQQATPLVSGRVEQVYAALGDRIQAGQPLAAISSSLIAQMRGKLHEAETRLALAERNFKRVEQAENRAAVLTARAKLDEAEATLKRTKRLIEIGAGAGKDLVAAETVYKTAKAEYDFQSNIALNKEIQEARAAVETAQVDVSHIRYEMKALGAPVIEGERDDHKHDTSLIILRAPISGTVIDRIVNSGAGIEAGKPLFTIANLSNIWVIANVPETQVSSLRVGATAQIHSAVFGAKAQAGRVSYIHPQLDEEVRTAHVRIEVANSREHLKPGMFVEVEFELPDTAGATGTEIVVPSDAIQRLEDRTVVFVPKASEPGHFEVREVEVGGESNGQRRILRGLKEGEQVVTQGSFTLKSQIVKSKLEDEH